jgi:Tfp pilus assembly protein PilV
MPMQDDVIGCGKPTGSRTSSEDGFGLVELLIAMTVLVIGILALFAMFESGIRHIRRASTVTTAAALADKEMENFRAIRYDSIGLPDTLVLAAAPPYSGDTAYDPDVADRVDLTVCGTSPCTTKVPVQTLTGADGESYRVDTYVTWQNVGTAPQIGRRVKLVTIVVRDADDTSKVWARTASSFDQSTGD